MTVGNMAAGRQGTGAVAESLHFDPQSRSAHIVPSVARLSLSVLRKHELVPAGCLADVLQIRTLPLRPVINPHLLTLNNGVGSVNM